MVGVIANAIARTTGIVGDNTTNLGRLDGSGGGAQLPVIRFQETVCLAPSDSTGEGGQTPLLFDVRSPEVGMNLDQDGVRNRLP